MSVADELTHLHRALEFVTNWEVAIDGGANLGYWSLVMADKFQHVLAFEPAEDTFKMLMSNTKGVDNIIRSPIALGSKDGWCEVCAEPKRERSSTYHRSRYVKEDVGTTALVSIDSLCLKNVGLIKLDLEGSEYFAIQGGIETIKKYKPVVIVEQDKFPMKRFGVENDAVEKLLVETGATKVDQMDKDAIYAFL